MRTFIGKEGYYDIEDNGNIIQRMVDSFGKVTGMVKQYRDISKIPNTFDREAVNNILRLLKIYTFVGRC
jgi:hypothetical protein